MTVLVPFPGFSDLSLVKRNLHPMETEFQASQTLGFLECQGNLRANWAFKERLSPQGLSSHLLPMAFDVP